MGRTGWDAATRRQGTKVHLAVETLGQLLALQVMPANERERAQVETLANAAQDVTGETVTLASVEQRSTGDVPRPAAAAHGIAPAVIKLPDVTCGFVLLPRRGVVEGDFGWVSRFRRLTRDQERGAEVLRGFHLVAFTMLMWQQAFPILSVL